MFAMVLLVLFVPHAAIPKTELYDVVERNHYHDASGSPIFTQLIFWDFDAQGSRYLCEGYVITSRDGRHGMCRLTVVDGGKRVIRGRRVRETWTDYDPEVEARQVLPMDLRRN